MRINPVYKKELVTTVRNRRIAIKIAAFNGIIALITLFAYFILFDAFDTTNMETSFAKMLWIYCILAFVELGLIFFVVPASTGGAIAGERENQTLEILLTTTLRPVQIIIGKLASSISFILLLLISAFPFVGIVFSAGGVTPGNLLELLGYLILVAIFIGSFGLLFSTKFRRTVPAIVFTYGTVIMLCGGTFFITFLVYAIVCSANADGSIGALVWILLLNPFLSMISLIQGQIGYTHWVGSVAREMGYCPTIMYDHWFVVSVVMQIIIAILLVLLSAHLLEPLNRKAKKKRH